MPTGEEHDQLKRDFIDVLAELVNVTIELAETQAQHLRATQHLRAINIISQQAVSIPSDPPFSVTNLSAIFDNLTNNGYGVQLSMAQCHG